MRKLAFLGAAIILAGSVGVAMAQIERAPQQVGFGTGVAPTRSTRAGREAR